MFVSTAYAQAGGAAGGGFDLVSFLPLILIFVVFYFLLIRPQQKKLKEHRSMLDALRRGDRVVTGGGIVGTVVKVGNDDEVMIEIAEGVRVRVLKPTITTVLAKTEPARRGGGGGSSAQQTDEPANADETAPAAAQPAQSPLGKLFGRK
jgi:preprotein translocase subunit YajC